MNPRDCSSSRTLSVILTYRCTAQCANCGTFSSPNDKQILNVADAMNSISEAWDLGFKNVVFTGGEATLEWRSLLECISHARSLGFPTRLVTNGHWGEHSPQYARELKQAGLDEINFSTGAEHARFVTLPALLAACQSSIACSLRTTLMFELHDDERLSRAALDQAIVDLAPNLVANDHFSIVESPWMPLDPAKSGFTRNLNATRETIAARRGCDSVLQTYVLQANGVYASCCGLGMRRIKSLQQRSVSESGALALSIEEAEGDLLKWALSAIGPEKILAWTAKHDESIKWEGKYAHRCHACIRLFGDINVADVIRKHSGELAAETIFQLASTKSLIPATFGR